MCADTTTSQTRRTQDSVTHVPGQLVTRVPSLYRACTVPRYGVRVNLAGRFRHSGAPNIPVIPDTVENPRTNATRKDVNRESGNH